MRRLMLMFLGALMLVAGAALLWTAQGPQSKQERTTGGVLYTQQEVAAASVPGGTDLGMITDTTAAVISEQPIAVAIDADAGLSQIAAEHGGAEAPLTINQVEMAGMAAVPLTTDIVLDEGTGVEVAPAQTEAGTTSDGQGGMTIAGMGYEQRVVEMEWPSKFQVGRGGALRIKLKMLEGGGLQAVAEVAGNEVIATPILLTDRYDTHDAFITATISAPDFEIDAVSAARQPLQRGGEVEWRWTLTADSAQQSVISLGLMITWEAKPGQPPGPTNVALWGQAVQVEVNYVFGLITVPQASYAGTALAVLGFAAQIPLADKILEGVWSLIFGRRRRQQRRSTANDRRSRRY